MESILEHQRKLHFDVDCLENSIVKLLIQPVKTHKERMVQDYNVSNILDDMNRKVKTLLTLHQDTEKEREREINSISTEFSEFYNKLKSIKDHHRRNPNEGVNEVVTDSTRPIVDPEGEEAFGKFLDMHALHEQYLNLKTIRKVTYLSYLTTFDNFADISREGKDKDYLKYLNDLTEYLDSFFKRSQPLINLGEIKREAIREFEDAWDSESLPGWDLNEHKNVDFSLYCAACKKQFAKETVFKAHFQGKKHIKASQQLQERIANGEDVSPEAIYQKHLQDTKSSWKDIAKKEFIIQKMMVALEPQREATAANVERKQTLTEAERLHEVEDEEIEIEESEDEDDGKLYNPLKLPLGWDGKPIPYWLYKLHGLGVEYPCEICGNYVYMGRKAFERHFQEWRHAHGMRCLGIPNSKYFHEITLIEDAYALWERINVIKKKDGSREDILEEFEDEEGNVFNKKTYEDLKRQGLL